MKRLKASLYSIATALFLGSCQDDVIYKESGQLEFFDSELGKPSVFQSFESKRRGYFLCQYAEYSASFSSMEFSRILHDWTFADISNEPDQIFVWMNTSVWQNLEERSEDLKKTRQQVLGGKCQSILIGYRHSGDRREKMTIVKKDDQMIAIMYERS